MPAGWRSAGCWWAARTCSACSRWAVARASSRLWSRGAWSSWRRSRSRSARNSAVDSRWRSGLLGGVDGQGLAARPGQGLGQLQEHPAGRGRAGPARRRPGVRVRPRHTGACRTGSGQLHVQPVDVLAAGKADQGPSAGQPLGAVASRRVGQIHPPVALSLTPTIQIRPRQADFPAIGAVQPDRQAARSRVKGGHDPSAPVGHPELGDGVVATDDPVADRQLAVLDLELLGAEPPRAARSSWQAVFSRSTSTRRAANTITSWAGSRSASCQAAHQSCKSARVAAGLESAATTRSWAR